MATYSKKKQEYPAPENAVSVPSIFLAPGSAPSQQSSTYNYNSSTNQSYQTGSTTTGGYVPSAAAMGNLSLVDSSGGYVPSAAGMGTASKISTPYTPSSTGGYVPSAAAMGVSSYKPATATATGGYVPSAAGIGSATSTGSSYIPSGAAMGISSYTPTTSTGGYVPSAAAMGTTGTGTSSSYTPSTAAMGSSYNTGGYVPSAAAMGTSSYTPATASTSTGGYVPSAAGMGTATGTSYSAAPTTSYATPSIFAAPPPSASPSPPKPKPPINNMHSQPVEPAVAPPPSHHSQNHTQQQAYTAKPHQQHTTTDASTGNALPNIFMISGCEDRQTSADVTNVNSIGKLPDPAGRAGGACTATLLKVLYENENRNLSFEDVMMTMRATLRKKGFKQIPQLTATSQMDLQHTTFSLVPQAVTGKRRAVMIGINYKGHRPGELRGCHNDVYNMRKYIQSRHGFRDEDIVMLVDDGKNHSPTRANILQAYRTVVAQSQPGDAVFLHYSGHGTKVKDLNGDEADGYDEAMCPLDFKKAGMIIDDDLYDIVVKGLPPGVHVSSVMDCCHSGTILDLPYIFKADGKQKQMVLDTEGHPEKFFSKFGLGQAAKLGAAVILGGILFG